MERIYLDYAATTPTHPEVVKAMLLYFDEAFGNPSSIYSYGQEAKGAIEEARTKVASLIGVRDEEIVFASGGTEADNLEAIQRFLDPGMKRCTCTVEPVGEVPIQR